MDLLALAAALMAGVPYRERTGGHWSVHQLAYDALSQVKDSSGAVLWTPDPQAPRLYGYDVEVDASADFIEFVPGFTLR